MKGEKLGIALVGLGRYSEGELGPALKKTEHCYLAGVVSGNKEKHAKWKKEYNLNDNSLFTYDNFDDIANNDEIDIVYIVLPNSMHAEYAIRAARAGKHVICEKPMATNIEDCRRMLEACAAANVRLGIGYRLHFDPFNKEMMRLGQDHVFGHVKQVILDDSMKLEEWEWRLDGALAGGGPLMNNGVYCVQAAIYITGELPVSVTANFTPVTNENLFKSVEEGIQWEMIFPSGCKAICESIYSKDGNLMHADAERGWFRLEPAYEYRGLKGETSEGEMKFEEVNQQALQMDEFAFSVKNKTETKVPGEMGLRDVEIMMAIYESAKSGKPVKLNLEQYSGLVEAPHPRFSS